MYRLLIIFLFVLFFFKTQAQKYFQQEVNYTIRVSLNDVKHELRGEETITYQNNSPDQLNYIYMHLWPNAYKNNNTALGKQLFENGNKEFYWAADSKRGFIDSLNFKINGQVAVVENDSQHVDICKLMLPAPLQPGESIEITTPFRVKIPDGNFSRLGHIKQQYQISQWYPKPAVYDKDGWHPIPYLDQGEFYSEFGKFDVYISVPQNYVVAATGNLIDNPEELSWLDKKANETAARNTFSETEMRFPESDKRVKTLHYQQDKVHDFAWFADKRYNVLKGEVELPKSGRKVTTWTFFNSENAKAWKSSIDFINKAVSSYSEWVGDYPYDVCSAVDGALSAGGGMEYPTITVISPTKDKAVLDLVIAHEVGHNWFYGILGSNERLHPWMDEGINSYYEDRYLKRNADSSSKGGLQFMNKTIRLKSKGEKNVNLNQDYLIYAYQASLQMDQPIELPGAQYSAINYGAIVYKKTALAFKFLEKYLGKSKMDEAMQAYFEEWKFKHPQPADIKKVLEEKTGKDLSWFFNDLFNTTKQADYKINNAFSASDGTYNVVVKNKSGLNVPVNLCGIKDGKMVAEVWYDGFKGIQNLGFPAVQVDYFMLDYKGDGVELNRNNNIYKKKGLFKRVEPFQLKFLAGVDHPHKTQLFFAPAYGWNNYNKSMLGLAFYNFTFPFKKFNFFAMPLYATGDKTLAGAANFDYTIYSGGKIQALKIGASASKYAYSTIPFDRSYCKIDPYVYAELKNKNARNRLKHSLKYRYLYIKKELAVGKFDNSYFYYQQEFKEYYFNDLTYQAKNDRPINPYGWVINYQSGDNMSKLSFTGNYSISYKKKRKSFDIRIFAGTFLNDANAGPYRFRTSAYRGYQDYFYDQIFLGRTETVGLLSQQLMEGDGAFKIYTPIGQTKKWLTAVNLKTSLPFDLPIRLYADFAYVADDGVIDQQFLYNGGVLISVWKNVFEIYLPIAMSYDIKQNIKINDWKYPETIRFNLNLNAANPFKLVKEIKM